MKSLFVPIFVLLTVTVYADQCCSPSSLAPLTLITFGQAPPQAEIVAPVPYAVERVTEATLFFPPPERFGPFLPKQDAPLAEEVPTTVRGQSRSTSEIAGIMDMPLPVARGPVDPETINPNLIVPPDPLDADHGNIGMNPSQSPVLANSATARTAQTDPVGYGVLIFVTVITSFGLVLMAYLAYDYRQRWMQSMTMQNDRYLGGVAFDMEWDGIYGGGAYSGSVPLYEGYGMAHRSI